MCRAIAPRACRRRRCKRGALHGPRARRLRESTDGDRGAAAGIGAGCAIRLAREGIAVGIRDLDVERCADTVGRLQGAGGRALAPGADISERMQVERAVYRLQAMLGPIDILVNNAAITACHPFLDMTEAQWERNPADQPDRHLHRDAARAARQGRRSMGPNHRHRFLGRAGRSEEHGAPRRVQGRGDRADAHVGGGARAWWHHGNVIPPRFITGTIMSEPSFAESRQPMNPEALALAGPIRREGRPEDIAGAVAWLASDEAGFVTGQVIAVKGGRDI
ncbi:MULTISPECIES: SDR family NAD(P)-dependent oxidoreductase [Hydrocarboniphaga]|uniref:SDR family NAD(P)-dependent oxidoreductase n=1 Tax=Hydrocarboniphaga effusa TaxID=243629 RepID=UPI0009FCC954|nr:MULTISPECIES: SDR family oxidoreductase [Hydrocarboniphaga]MDZ4077845.1 SDR family oxidoreductase [Hydrocarboniphaga sp.]